MIALVTTQSPCSCLASAPTRKVPDGCPKRTELRLPPPAARLTSVPGIAAAVPICGGGDPSQAIKFKEVPIWAFHGEADPVVPVKSTREMISALEAAGGKPKATYYPEVEHDSWTRTYDDPAVIRWIFDQHR